MKKFRFLSLLWLVVIAWTLAWCLDNNNTNEWSNNQDFIIEDVTEKTNAVIDYNDTMVDLAYNCISSEDAIWDAYTSDVLDIEGIRTSVDNTLKECSNAISQIEALGGWEWDNSLKDGVITLLQKGSEYYKKLWETVSYLENPDWLTEEEATAYEALKEEFTAIGQEYEAANANLIDIQSQFAANHGFELEEMEWDELPTEEVVAE